MELHLGTPNPKQHLFFQAREPVVAFGGARGGGKSWAVRTKAVLLCLRYAGIKVMIVRKTYPELWENHILPLTALLGCGGEAPLATYSDSKKHIRFPNGSRILFRYCDTDGDTQRFQGTEVDVLFVDEATQQTEQTIRELSACVRGTGDFPRRIYYTCNPGGPGHGWVKRLFIDRRYVDGERPEDYRFIQSLVTDNTALLEKDPNYVNRLKALPPKLRRAWLEGDWNIFDGQFFEEFRDDPAHYGDGLRTHVIEPFEIPPSWRIYRSFDWGYAKPFSCRKLCLKSRTSAPADSKATAFQGWICVNGTGSYSSGTMGYQAGYVNYPAYSRMENVFLYELFACGYHILTANAARTYSTAETSLHEIELAGYGDEENIFFGEFELWGVRV